MTQKQQERYDYIIGALAEEIEITPHTIKIKMYDAKTTGTLRLHYRRAGGRN